MDDIGQYDREYFISYDKVNGVLNDISKIFMKGLLNLKVIKSSDLVLMLLLPCYSIYNS